MESKNDGRGFWNRKYGDSIRHSLAARGYKTTGEKKDLKLDKAKQLASEDALSWREFKKIYGDESEKMLNKCVENGGIELDEVDEYNGDRLRYGHVKVDIEDDDGEVKSYVVSPETQIKFIESN